MMKAAAMADSFIYIVSVTGVTGARTEVSKEVGDVVAGVRKVTESKGIFLAVGFGVSSRTHVEEIGKFADGAVVGSKIVDALGSGGGLGAMKALVMELSGGPLSDVKLDSGTQAAAKRRRTDLAANGGNSGPQGSSTWYFGQYGGRYIPETLMQAQLAKLDYVANAIELKKGDHVLDIGCGWGRLVQHFTDKYAAKVTGVTLSSEQRKYGEQLNQGNSGRILLQDAMKLYERNDLPPGGFDAITSLEMAEHVGIKRYNEFLTKVHSLLKDDGKLYFQVAGLRRQWQYEDLVWGLFMGEHVFPGADASCPMGWVTTQLERAGFEVQRVQNLGSHYSRTLAQWLEEWHADKEAITKKYGPKAWRRWEVFLAWSVRVARQGSSTVFMITATKQGQEKSRIGTQAHLAP